MPEFVDIATHFDDTDLYDGYTGLFLFRGQFNTFDEASRDGSVLRKRILSLHPSLVTPVRKVITFMGETWLVGDSNVEGFQGSQVRKAYWMKKVTDTAALLTPAEACNGAAGASVKVQKEYLKDTVNSASDAQYYPFWEVSMAPVEGPVKGGFLRIGTKLYRFRSVRRDLSGLDVAATDELGSVVTVTLNDSGTFDPITETYSGGTSTVPGIVVEPSKLFTLKTDADPKVHSGDLTLVTASALAVGRNITVASEKFQVMTSTPELDGYASRIRRQ